MEHLTDEQLEEILGGAGSGEGHLDDCATCRARLAERRAMAHRLRQAFAGVHAGSDLAGRILASVGGARQSTDPEKPFPRAIDLRWRRRVWSVFATAAVILVTSVPIGLYVRTASQARAARREIVAIHRENLESLDELFIHEDPGEHARYLEDQTGHAPALPCTGTGISLCGCCVRPLGGRVVGSYVVETRSGRVSVVVVPGRPKLLGSRPVGNTAIAERALWRAPCEDCIIAAVHLGDHTYYAVGRGDPEELEHLLDSLLR